MFDPVLELAKLAVVVLNQHSERTFVRRYAPEFEAKNLKNGLWFVIASTDSTESNRAADKTKLEIDLCYQIALPDPTVAIPNQLDNLEFLDGCMYEVSRMKAMFREGGLFRQDDHFGQFTFMGQSSSPLYHQEALLYTQVFISAIRLKFFANLEAEDLQS